MGNMIGLFQRAQRPLGEAGFLGRPTLFGLGAKLTKLIWPPAEYS
jgi:hypothetical protein